MVPSLVHLLYCTVSYRRAETNLDHHCTRESQAVPSKWEMPSKDLLKRKNALPWTTLENAGWLAHLPKENDPSRQRTVAKEVSFVCSTWEITTMRATVLQAWPCEVEGFPRAVNSHQSINSHALHGVWWCWAQKAPQKLKVHVRAWSLRAACVGIPQRSFC